MKIQILDTRACAALHVQLADLLLDAALHDGLHVGAGSAPGRAVPLDRAAAQQYWDGVAACVQAGTRLLLAAVHDGTLIGAVQLDLCQAPGGGNQAEVKKMMVHSRCRRRGIGGVLLRAVEAEARQLGRPLLFLDTEAGSGAAALYDGLGYTCVDDMPDAACAPRHTAVYYKQLLALEPA